MLQPCGMCGLMEVTTAGNPITHMSGFPIPLSLEKPSLMTTGHAFNMILMRCPSAYSCSWVKSFNLHST